MGRDPKRAPKPSRASTKTQSLPDEVNESGRRALQALVDARYGGVRQRAAREIGVTKQTLGDYLNGSGGAGAKIAYGLVHIDPMVALAVLGRDFAGLSSPTPWVG